MKNNVFRANFGVDSSQVKRHSLAPHAMSLQLSRRCAVSVPHVFRCPVGPAHRPRNSTSHERSLIPPPACLFVVLTPFFPPTNPLPFYQFFYLYYTVITQAPRRCENQQKRSQRAATGRQAASPTPAAAASAHPPSLPSAPASLCRRHLRFLWRKREASEGSERASAENTPQIPLTYRSSLVQSVHQAEKALQHTISLSFFSHLRPHSARTHARAGRPDRRAPGGGPSLSLSAGSSGLSRPGGAEIRPRGRRLLPRCSAGE